MNEYGVYMSENNNDESYVCSKCGNVVKLSSRYCMKCGQINPSHPANADFIKNSGFKEQMLSSNYQLGGGNIIPGVAGSESAIPIATNTGNTKLCFILNFSAYILITILCVFVTISGLEFSLDAILHSNIPFLLFGLSLFFLFTYASQLLFIKSNKRWWTSFIPIYNIFVLSEIAFNKKILGLVAFIPIIGEFYLLAMFYKIGKRFQFSGLLSMLFFPLILLAIAYGSHIYDDHGFVEEGGSFEKDYKMRKLFFSTAMIFTVIGVGIVTYVHFDEIKNFVSLQGSHYYVSAAKKIASKTQKATEANKVSCDYIDFGIPGAPYSFYFDNLADEVYLPFSYLRESIHGYVIVTFLGDGNIQYEVAVADGAKRIDLVDSTYLADELVVDNVDNPPVIDTTNVCRIVK